jgi:hypothetical protein
MILVRCEEFIRTCCAFNVCNTDACNRSNCFLGQKCRLPHKSLDNHLYGSKPLIPIVFSE